MTSLDLRAVQIFVTVAAERSFRRAAERLHLSPASVSQAVRRLERHVGTRLLDRSTRRVGLTAHGEVLLDASETLLAAADALERVATGLADVAALRIGTLFGLGADVVDCAATTATGSDRVTRVDLVGYGWTDPSCGLGSAAVDLAILAGPNDRDVDLVRLSLGTEPFVAMAAGNSPLGQHNTVDLADLDAYGWTQVRTPDTRWREHWRLDHVRGGPPPEHPEIHDSPESLFFAVRRGRGVWTTLASYGQHFNLRDLALIPLRGVDPVAIDIAYRRDRTSSAIERFAHQIAAAATCCAGWRHASSEPHPG